MELLKNAMEYGRNQERNSQEKIVLQVSMIENCLTIAQVLISLYIQYSFFFHS